MTGARVGAAAGDGRGETFRISRTGLTYRGGNGNGGTGGVRFTSLNRDRGVAALECTVLCDADR
jgi:hypothetical protein